MSPADILTGLFIQLFILILKGWWIILPLVLLYYASEAWRYYKYEEKRLGTKWVLLEIKIPRGIMKTPEAMERVFAGLHGPYDPPKEFNDVYLNIKIRLNYSFEIVGQEGSTRFYIYCPKAWRNLVEAQIYGQYPEVMISEAEDYAKFGPKNFPSDEYEIWGLEMQFMKEDAYPILTYKEYKSLVPGDEEKWKVDPLSAISESFAKLHPGEQLWYQILARPCGTPGKTSAKDKWQEAGQALVDKLAGKEKPKVDPWWKPYTEIASALVEEIPEHFKELASPGSSSGEQGLGRLSASTKKEDAKREPSKMLHSTPGEKTVIEAIEQKIGKLGYECIVRLVYIGRKDVFDHSHIATIFAIIQQFNTRNLNGFRLNSATMTKRKNYFWGFYRSRRFELNTKNSLLYFYRKRSPFWDFKKVLPLPVASRFSRIISGLFYRLFPNQIEYMRSKTLVLNIEELATMFHFPGETVSSPTMPRMESKQGGPPINLPVG
ncbi:MAG: hypothetical protein A3H71_02735 [Candidatus Sungbacteria bacterium RIFCSPLOWO2_02_FULL_48_13b]|uniref:DUF8128 domain-containing protein n=1 Tax=Candidatus Sungbacteria bacterium RIFCSPLOWO2_02_FULL_48_13b TaxID=1802283 RepID=A0A1G2LJ48_9BACT|nr:MAG: hypothetical protein A3H71_02735 [Candidatus Sungbacteria bacterium RIFCSPLOWO2_02_FULL_48_13b]